MLSTKWISAGLVLCTLGLTARLPADAPAEPEPMRIGMVSTLFTDIPMPLIQLIAAPFSSLMKDYTGLEGRMNVSGDPLETARKLNDKALDLAVLHGVEFAWAQQKFPELRPLMVATNKIGSVRAHLVVRADCDAKCWEDMKGKDVSLPRRSKEHCRLFLQRRCLDCDPKTYFHAIVASPNVEAALDDCCQGKVHAVITDTLALDFYQNLKPGCFARLKLLTNSEVFPPGVIVYRQGHLDEATLKKFREGMARANADEKGREVLFMFKINAFEPVPDNYGQMLANIIKAYPPPPGFVEKVSSK